MDEAAQTLVITFASGNVWLKKSLVQIADMEKVDQSRGVSPTEHTTIQPVPILIFLWASSMGHGNLGL